VVGVVSVVAGSVESVVPVSVVSGSPESVVPSAVGVVSVFVRSVEVVVPLLAGVFVVADAVGVVVGGLPSAAADEIVAAATPEAANTTAMNSIDIRRLSRELI
jgi:hypothetical protein